MSGIINVHLSGTVSYVWHASLCAGKPVYDDSGELVCTRPFPSMPTHFWNDEDGIKYTKAYFTKFQGVCVCACLCTRMHSFACYNLNWEGSMLKQKVAFTPVDIQ